MVGGKIEALRSATRARDGLEGGSEGTENRGIADCALGIVMERERGERGFDGG